MNSLALKYLNDAQLSKLAEQHRINAAAAKGGERKGGETLSREGGGGGGVDMSFATHEFLCRHGLAQAADGQRQPLRSVNGGEAATPLSRRAAPVRQRLATQKSQAANKIVQSDRWPFYENQQAVRDTPSPLPLRPVGMSPPAFRQASLPRPEISNRILDITAIRQQTKML